MTRYVKEIQIQYKYPGYPWIEYDRTKVSNWAEAQFERMKQEYPGAEYRKVQDGKEIK
jgi:hypothetical protein